MLVECRTCPVRETHCADCVVTVLGLLSQVDEGTRAEDSMDLDTAEREAVGLFVRAGMVRREHARLVRAVSELPRDYGNVIPLHRATG